MLLKLLALAIVAVAAESPASANAPGTPDAAISVVDWTKMSFVERVKSYDWRKEAFLVVFTAGYLVLHFYGGSLNKKKVEKWIASTRPELESQFAQVGTHHPHGEQYVADSHDQYTTYATGRVNVRSLTAKFSLGPRQNFILLLLEKGLASFFPALISREEIQVTIVPDVDASKKIDPAIFAIVNKDGMQRAREESYYLSLTRTTESPKLPIEFVFMTESGEVADVLFTPELAEALAAPGATRVLQHLAYSDQAIDRPTTPEEALAKPLVALTLKFPNNAEEEAATSLLLSAAINLVDVLESNGRWRPEAARKIKATRDAELKKVQKAIEEKRAEENALAKAEAKREERAKLSPAEQRKLEQKEREKDARRQQKKQTRRVR